MTKNWCARVLRNLSIDPGEFLSEREISEMIRFDEASEVLHRALRNLVEEGVLEQQDEKYRLSADTAVM